MEEKMGIGLGVIILNDNNEVLLLLRNSDSKIADSNMHYEGQYTLPAGKVKFGEEIEFAAMRKVKQETNLDIDEPQVICFVNDYNEHAHYATLGVLAKAYSGDVDLGNTKEQVGYVWANINELPDNLCKSSAEILKLYKEKKWYKN